MSQPLLEVKLKTTMKLILMIVGEVMVGLSVVVMPKIGLWFLIPWVIDWQINNFAQTL